jgi:8-oxo-dGTP pyrophosphatase MutT (NUDIX family)
VALPPLVARLAERLAVYRPTLRPHAGLVHSAVLVPLVPGEDGQVQVLFTVRTDLVQHHKGQISFPGGRADDGDDGDVHTALRETEEELGIPPGHVRVLGRLSDMPTITAYLIVPVVGWLDRRPDLKPHAAEVAEVFEVPLEALLDGSVPHRTEGIVWQGQARTMHFFDHGRHTIWGATGRILAELLDLLRT